MAIQRCPECGIRLRTNYCDICMKRVPFKGMPEKQTFQTVSASSAHATEAGHSCVSFEEKRKVPWGGSSAHRTEKGHTCVSFEKEWKKVIRTPAGKTAGKKTAPAVAILLAVLSLLPSLFGFFEEAMDSVAAPEPDYSVQEGFLLAGDPGAEDVPNVISGEIYNANGIRVTVDAAGLSYGDYTILMTVYNDTDRDISVSMDLVSVNGYMVPFGLFQDVKTGKSEQTGLTFYAYTLEEAGITQVADVEIVMDIYDAKSYDGIVEKELLRIETEYSGTAEPAVDISGMELYNDGSLCVLLRDVNLPGQGECALDLYIENLSGSSVNVYSGDIWVNGEQLHGYYWKALRPDTRAVDSAYIYELDDLDIEELAQIEEITMDLYVDYMDGLNVVQTISEKITFDPGMIY